MRRLEGCRFDAARFATYGNAHAIATLADTLEVIVNAWTPLIAVGDTLGDPSKHKATIEKATGTTSDS